MVSGRACCFTYLDSAMSNLYRSTLIFPERRKNSCRPGDPSYCRIRWYVSSWIIHRLGCATKRYDVVKVRCIHAEGVRESKKSSAKTSSTLICVDRNYTLSVVTSGRMRHWRHFLSLALVITRHFIEKKSLKQQKSMSWHLVTRFVVRSIFITFNLRFGYPMLKSAK